MSLALRALLSEIIDYAGLFPPAKLPLEQALRNYADYRQGPDRWMLGRFICPAARLSELAPFQEGLFQTGAPFVFSALGRGGNSAAEFLSGLQADLEAVTAFRERHGPRVVVDVFEVRLPAELTAPNTARALAGLLASATEMLEAYGPPPITPFYEAALAADWQEALATVLGVLANGNQYGSGPRQDYRPAVLKLRCGGLEASAVPSVAQLAHVVTACRSLAVPLKATAGLHHPVRHFDNALQTRLHGFLNVFGAAVLAHLHHLDEDKVRQIVADEEASDFRFEDAGFRWNGLEATPEEIDTARRQFAISFGSCSFDEPRQDLRALGLLCC
jgi:hypothetical protein